MNFTEFIDMKPTGECYYLTLTSKENKGKLPLTSEKLQAHCGIASLTSKSMMYANHLHMLALKCILLHSEDLAPGKFSMELQLQSQKFHIVFLKTLPGHFPPHFKLKV